MKLVSIVIPTYNGEKYIRETINSCLNQTYKHIQLIIVNDGSTDNTEKIINSYKDKRIVYLKHKKNLGLPEALNTGFDRAEGDYLTWISDDNYYSEEAIERMVRFLEENNCDFVYSNFYKVDNKKIKKVDTSKIDYKKSNWVGACFLYTKQVKDAIGDYDPEARLVEDYDYFLRVFKKFRMCHLNKYLLYYRVHENRLFNKKRYEIRMANIKLRLKYGYLTEDQAKKEYARMKANKRMHRLRMFSVKGIRFLPTFLISIILTEILYLYYWCSDEKDF